MSALRAVLAGRAGRITAFVLVLLASCAAPVLADSPPESPPAETQSVEQELQIPPSASQELAEAAETESSSLLVPQATDPSAAEGVSHEDLGRQEALKMLMGVFGAELEGPAGPFDELHVEKFLADNVAVIPPGQQPEAPASEEGDSGYEGPTLLESTVPLRTEGEASGQEEVVDLGLEHAEGQLQQVNPLVEVGVPNELGEGIDLPETGVQIELKDAPAERTASTVSKSVAFYPNVTEDTDFAVAPTPTGVETFTQIRSPSASLSQTLTLNLPAGANLSATKDGGAKVAREEGEEEALVSVPPPTAIDASGAKVPVSLEVAGDSLTLEVSPEESTQFPILVDPLFQSYEWYAKKTRAGINDQKGFEEEWSREGIQHKGGYEYLCSYICSIGQDPPLYYELPGLWAQKGELNTNGDYASWAYTVPRYYKDQEKYGERPHSYINHMILSDLSFKGNGAANSPYLVAGLWDANNGWVSLLQHEGSAGHGLIDMSYAYQFVNNVSKEPKTVSPDTAVKLASAGLWSLESGTNGVAHLYVGAATIELAEPESEVPKFSPPSGPSNWVNTTASPISFSVEEAGLGIYAVTVSDEQTPSHSWKTSYGCTGVGDNACPRGWSSAESGHPALKYEPVVLPQGTDTLNLVAEDPIGHVSAPAKFQVKVDHTAPELTLSGPLTEQTKLGYRRATYALNINATDGSESSPQSGVAKTVIQVDGKVVDQSSPGCSTRNCAITREWPLETSKYSAGQHTVKVTATDAVGLSTTETLPIELEPIQQPTVSLAGSMTEQATRGTSRALYQLKVHAAAEAGETYVPATSSSIGTYGKATGQFSHPAGIAVDKNGIWVVDEENHRVEKFNEAGKYSTAFGAVGTADGKFGRPTDVALDSKGNLWVIDAGNNRVEEFNEKRVFVTKFGTAGNATGQLAEPEGIAVDAKGNIWVADTHNGRLQKFNEAGEFISAFYGNGTLVEPTGIDNGPEGKIWVADRAANRVDEFNEAGELLTSFGSEGTGRYQFVHPDVIEVDSQGDIWVGDEGNGRVVEFNEGAEYLAQFGSEGSGQGQFAFSAPMGIGADTHGNIWVADPNNNRVQEWQIPAYVPTTAGTFGSYGAAAGQFKHPAGLDLDANGNLWVVDKTNSRLEEFNQAGEYEGGFGTKGTEDGKLTYPTDVAIDPSGNLWVADAGNCRIEKFTPAGSYLAKIAIEPREGICKGAEGVAVDASGNLWVADTNNDRVLEFTSAGKLIRTVGPTEGPGQLLEPKGIDIAPDGKVWVSDWVGDRVVEFTEAGAFIRQFGSEGIGPGQFKGADAIEVDSKGDVWVGDEKSRRIEEFNKSGEYIAQFGSGGTGEGQFTFTFPMGLVTDTKGNIWVSDTGNNRVQRWNHSNIKSEITTEITMDGKAVDSGSASCPDTTCPTIREWVLESPEYPEGKHTVQVKATDGLGWSTTKTQAIELTSPPPPTVSISGTMTEQATLGTTRPRYKLKVNAATTTGEESTTATPSTFVSSFGSSGAGSGQFSHSAGIAIDSKGNLLVVDENNKRVEKFNEAGEYLSSFGSSGTENGKFSRPTDVAIDPKGNLWVTDAGNSRIEEFNEKGEFVAKFGSQGSDNLQFSGPESLAIDAKGNIWVGDTYNHRVQELNEKGEFIRTFGTYGSGQGQIVESTGIAVSPGGKVWVADWGNNRVEEFSESGDFIRQFGTLGAGSAQFNRPDVIDVDTRGDVWVGDERNERIQEFNQNGEYVTQFGSAGSGSGQFSFGWPMGIATDSKGRIWVADTGNNRVQRWQIPNYVPTYASSFGTGGTGKGQLTHPAGIAADAKGNLWVADEENRRVEEFNKGGEYVGEFGSAGEGNGQFNRPTDMAIDSKGNIWVTDAGNSRLEEFNEKGEFIKKVGSIGEGNGQFQGPESLAIDAKGNIWVGDTYNHRVQELNEKGEFIRTFGTNGSGPGQIIESTGIAVGPGGNVWVADWGNDRVEEFSEAGDFIRQFGSEGTGNGQFIHPDVIDVDIHGDVWVGDESNDRVQQFNQNGDYVTQFGSAGEGSGQFNLGWPMGIASDSKGHLWMVDTGNDRIQKWIYYTSPSEIETEVTVDGTKVDSSRVGCTTETCPITDEWTLESPQYKAGKHTVQVKATDGYGHSTTKTLSVEVQPDTTKPTLEVGGELANAPEGWVEQESYGLNASANDTGYGNTSLSFVIDGEQIASVGKACAEGGCSESMSKSIDMEPYSGGSHSAELVATDGAGNTAREAWTLNVDPQGHVTAVEADETLEAADMTTGSGVVAPTDEAISLEEREDGNSPSLSEGENGIESSGVPDLSTIGSNPDDGFTINTPEASIHAEPTTVNNGVTSMVISEESVAVAGNTITNVDTVVRPIFNGVMAFQSIRDITAPESYSWKVNLAEGETLKSIDPRDAEVDFEDGSEALLITAEFAHDALGKDVPTLLSVSEGDVVTLTVSHRENSYVYPVVAGSGWEGGFSTTIVARPKDEQELREERERIEREERERIEREWEELSEGEGDEPAGELNEVWDTSEYRPKLSKVNTSAPKMTNWVHRTRESTARASYCAWLSCSIWHTWEEGTWFWNGTRGHVGGEASRGDTASKCHTSEAWWVNNEPIRIDWAGPNPAPYGHGEHLNLWCTFEVKWLNANGLEDNNFKEEDHLYGDGFQKQHIKQYFPIMQN